MQTILHKYWDKQLLFPNSLQFVFVNDDYAHDTLFEVQDYSNNVLCKFYGNYNIIISSFNGFRIYSEIQSQEIKDWYYSVNDQLHYQVLDDTADTDITSEVLPDQLNIIYLKPAFYNITFTGIKHEQQTSGNYNTYTGASITSNWFYQYIDDNFIKEILGSNYEDQMVDKITISNNNSPEKDIDYGEIELARLFGYDDLNLTVNVYYNVREVRIIDSIGSISSGTMSDQSNIRFLEWDNASGLRGTIQYKTTPITITLPNRKNQILMLSTDLDTRLSNPVQSSLYVIDAYDAVYRDNPSTSLKNTIVIQPSEGELCINSITKNIDIAIYLTQYVSNDKVTVTFCDEDGTVLKQSTITSGSQAPDPPSNLTKPGYRIGTESHTFQLSFWYYGNDPYDSNKLYINSKSSVTENRIYYPKFIETVSNIPSYTITFTNDLLKPRSIIKQGYSVSTTTSPYTTADYKVYFTVSCNGVSQSKSLGIGESITLSSTSSFKNKSCSISFQNNPIDSGYFVKSDSEWGERLRKSMCSYDSRTKILQTVTPRDYTKRKLILEDNAIINLSSTGWFESIVVLCSMDISGTFTCIDTMGRIVSGHATSHSYGVLSDSHLAGTENNRLHPKWGTEIKFKADNTNKTGYLAYGAWIRYSNFNTAFIPRNDFWDGYYYSTERQQLDENATWVVDYNGNKQSSALVYAYRKAEENSDQLEFSIMK